MNILVTGGAGFIGSHLVDALVDAGHRVRILDSLVEQVHGDGVPPHLNKEAEFVRGDVCDAEAVRAALDGIDVVYHHAAEVGVGQSMYEIVRYVKANRTAEEKPLFPTSVYAVSKQDQEQYCLAVGRAYKIPTVAFRYFNVYGTRQALSNPYTGVCAIFSSRLLNDQAPTIFEDGEQSRDFVHVSDIVQANMLALESDGGDYESMNIGTGRATSVKQIAQLLARGLGKDIEPVIVGKYREGDIRHCVADIEKATKLIGYQPKVSLEDGLAELLDWLGQQDAEDRVETATAELSQKGLVK